MALLPDTLRAVVATAVACNACFARARQYLETLSGITAEIGASIQVFAHADALEESPDVFVDLAADGHAVDLLAPSRVSLEDADVPAARADIQAAKRVLDAHLPSPSIGLRLPTMQRIGIQKNEELQRAILGSGLGFIAADYSTKLPPDPSNPGFADKNAAMLIKHSQPRWYPAGLLEVPAAGYSDRDFFIAQGRSLDEWIAHLKQCVDFASDMGGLVYAPALHVDVLTEHDPEAASIQALFEHAASKRAGKVGFCTHRDIYEWARQTTR